MSRMLITFHYSQGVAPLLMGEDTEEEEAAAVRVPLAGWKSVVLLGSSRFQHFELPYV